MNHESNPYLRVQDEVNKAKNKWATSEHLLKLLRSETGQEPLKPSDEQLLQWAKKLH